MKKIYFYLTLILFFFTIFANAQVVENTDTTDIGVEINGVVWATRNVNAPSTFANSNLDMGMFYQWNIKVGWSSADPMIATNGSTVWNTTPSYSRVWQPENDPCPNGWRMPNIQEVESLISSPNSYHKYYYNYNNEAPCPGRVFKGDNDSIFIPEYSMRDNRGLIFIMNPPRHTLAYWSGETCSFAETQSEEHLIKVFLLSCLNDPNRYVIDMVTFCVSATLTGFPVRCVKKENTDESVTGVTLNKTETLLVVGTDEQLIANIQPTNAANQNISWNSSNQAVADVSQIGLVSAISVGTATISVTTQDGGHTAMCDVTITDNTGIDYVAENSILIFPNPVKNELYINFSDFQKSESFNVAISDISGKNILISNQSKINVSQFLQGIYFIKIKTDKGIKTQKFIKK